MKTANFNTAKNTEIAVAITVSMSKYVYVRHQYKELAPSWALLSAFRDGKIGESEYIERFNKQLSKLDAKKVYADICKLVGSDDPVLVCHCSKNHFCHRHLVAEWLENALGIKITEIGHERTARSKGYCRNDVPQNTALF